MPNSGVLGRERCTVSLGAQGLARSHIWSTQARELEVLLDADSPLGAFSRVQECVWLQTIGVTAVHQKLPGLGVAERSSHPSSCLQGDVPPPPKTNPAKGFDIFSQEFLFSHSDLHSCGEHLPAKGLARPAPCIHPLLRAAPSPSMSLVWGRLTAGVDLWPGLASDSTVLPLSQGCLGVSTRLKEGQSELILGVLLQH